MLDTQAYDRLAIAAVGTKESKSKCTSNMMGIVMLMSKVWQNCIGHAHTVERKGDEISTSPVLLKTLAAVDGI